jgi:flagellar hook-associated protein 1 FlgK
MSISNIFELSKRSLLTYQAAMNTTTGNIANVNTEGYVRRKVDIRNMTVNFQGLGQLGIGVSADHISRVRQQLAEQQLWSENQHLGRYETGEMVLSQVENVFGESGDAGLSNAINAFWDSWNDLANDPESQANRSFVRDKAVILADTFNRITSDFGAIKDQLSYEIRAKVTNVNRLTEQIAMMNQELKTTNSPELMDQRDMLVKDLSKLINISVREQETGEISISTDGILLVSGSESNKLKAGFSGEGQDLRAQISFADMNYSPKISSGELGSLMENFNEFIPDYLQDLDTLAVSFAEKVNQVHSKGYNLDGITGINFFKAGVTGAADIQVDAALIADSSLIASRNGSDASGGNSIAMEMANLQYDRFVNGQSVNDFYNGLMSRIGNKVQETKFLHSSQQLVVTQLEAQKESISGVSLDEEMTRLMQYQQAYEAATKVVQTVDEMMQTVMNML